MGPRARSILSLATKENIILTGVGILISFNINTNMKITELVEMKPSVIQNSEDIDCIESDLKTYKSLIDTNNVRSERRDSKNMDDIKIWVDENFVKKKSKNR